MPEIFATEILMLAAIFLVAILYSSVGHGGASGYLAVMALFAVSVTVTRPTALMLNLFVASIAFVQFYRAKYFDGKVFLPFAVASIPMAYIGGSIQTPEVVYKIILGAVLILAAGRLAINFQSEKESSAAPPVWMALLIGGFIGLVSGLVGVGGGIFLTPVLLLMNWTETKKAAGISALFILVNSISGLLGNYEQVLKLSSNVWLWVGAAILGGLTGATLGSGYFNSLVLRRLLAGALVISGLKLIFT